MQENDIELWQMVSKSYDQTNSIFFIENFTIVVWKVAQGPTDMGQKHLTHSESLSFNIEATCLLLLSPRNFLYEIKMDKYRPCPAIIAMFTSDSQHPPKSRHAVYLGDVGYCKNKNAYYSLYLYGALIRIMFVILFCMLHIVRTRTCIIYCTFMGHL